MNPVRRRRLAGLAAIGAIALLAGCGGGSDDGASTSATATATATALSADEFRMEATDICADARRGIDAVPDPESAAGIVTTLEAVLPIAEERLEKLKALDPPQELQSSYDEAMRRGEEQLSLGRQLLERVDGGEEATAVYTELEPQLTENQRRSSELANELGVPECASDDAVDTSTTSTAAPSTSGDASTDSTSAGATAEPGEYLTDVQAAAGALSSFGTLLQSVSSPDDLKAKAPEARKRLDAFDAAIRQLDTYTLDNPKLERQRAGLVRTGPRVGATLREFTDAAARGDLAEIQRLVPEIQSAIGDFQSAATDVG